MSLFGSLFGGNSKKKESTPTASAKAPAPTTAPAAVTATLLPAGAPAVAARDEKTWPCANGCGFTAYGGFSTCCRTCTGPNGSHAKDCREKNQYVLPQCEGGCGRFAFAPHRTCCRACKGSSGPHAQDCLVKQRGLGLALKDDACAVGASGSTGAFVEAWSMSESATDHLTPNDYAGYCKALAKLVSRGHGIVRQAALAFLQEQVHLDKFAQSRFAPFELKRKGELDRITIDLTVQKAGAMFKVCRKFSYTILHRAGDSKAQEAAAMSSRATETSSMDELNPQDLAGFSVALASWLSRGDELINQAVLGFMEMQGHAPKLDKAVQSEFAPFELLSGTSTKRVVVEITVIKRSDAFHVSYRSSCSTLAEAVDGLLLDNNGGLAPLAPVKSTKSPSVAPAPAPPPMSTVRDSVESKLKSQLLEWQQAGLMQTPEDQQQVITSLALCSGMSAEAVRMLWLSIACTTKANGGPASIYVKLAEKHHGLKTDVVDLGMYSANSVNSCMFLCCAASIADRRLQGHDDCFPIGFIQEQLESACDWSGSQSIEKLVQEHKADPRASTLGAMADMLRHVACEVISHEEAFYLAFFNDKGAGCQEAFHRWLAAMRGNEEGDELVMLALARLCGIAIQAVQQSGYMVPVMDPTGSASSGCIVYWGNDNHHWVWLRPKK